ncbi:hypothetical protein [Desulfosporosinus nitroreducens]|nr:hypothetical protein [Desulfosporosinus nitroreducens]MCO1604720.1 hypothetical protein [Desulfosporosinus nitroreducens]
MAEKRNRFFSDSGEIERIYKKKDYKLELGKESQHFINLCSKWGFGD